MISLKDQLGRELKLAGQAQKIVCLVPSITELLIDLGLGAKVVGRTKFCIYPAESVENIPKIGGTKQVHVDRITELVPDLIICNKEENTQEIVESLKDLAPIYVSNIQTIHAALEMISDIGILAGVEKEAASLIDKIEKAREAWFSREHQLKPCIYLIWQKPYMTIGRDTFIYQMLQEMNFDSVIFDFRYPEISLEVIRQSEAKYLLLSNEPFPFGQKELNILQEQLPEIKVLLVDGSYFSWYGSRLAETYNYFQKLTSEIEGQN